MKTLISKLQDAGIMIFLDGSETIHYKAYRDLDEGAAKMLLQELKRRKQEAVAYLTRQDEIFQAYAAMFEAFKKFLCFLLNFIMVHSYHYRVSSKAQALF